MLSLKLSPQYQVRLLTKEIFYLILRDILIIMQQNKISTLVGLANGFIHFRHNLIFLDLQNSSEQRLDKLL